MKCFECGYNKMLDPVLGETQYICGLDVTLVGVSIFKCPNCKKETVRIPAPAALSRFLAIFVASKTGKLAPEEFRFLRKELGYSKEDFAQKIDIACSELIEWEQGNQTIPIRYERYIRLQSLIGEPVEEYSDLQESILSIMSSKSFSSLEPLRPKVQWKDDHWDTQLESA